MMVTEVGRAPTRSCSGPAPVQVGQFLEERNNFHNRGEQTAATCANQQQDGHEAPTAAEGAVTGRRGDSFGGADGGGGWRPGVDAPMPPLFCRCSRCCDSSCVQSQFREITKRNGKSHPDPPPDRRLSRPCTRLPSSPHPL